MLPQAARRADARLRLPAGARRRRQRAGARWHAWPRRWCARCWRFEARGLRAASPRAYARRDLLRGQPVQHHAGRRALEGVAEGVDEQRRAARARATARARAIVSGEVSVRLRDGRDAEARWPPLLRRRPTCCSSRWTQGWLAPVLPPAQHGEREPRAAGRAGQRRGRCSRDDGRSAASAAQASIACVEAGPFADADIGGRRGRAGRRRRRAAGLRRRERAAADGLAGLHRPAARRGRAAGAQADALQRLRVPHQTLQSPPELAPGLVLARHDQREDAERALAQVAERGVRGARVVALPPPPLQHWLRVARADAELRAVLDGVALPAGERFARCR
ncbi:MAG: hypothetical protein MZW92_14355 [Comamonadaceae bacterium]|nr:hypothetical protein [Comamonadaceae bacterium]